MTEIPIVLLVGTETEWPSNLESSLNDEKIETVLVDTLENALGTLKSLHCHVMLVDVRCFSDAQLRFLKLLKSVQSNLFVIGQCSNTGPNSAVELWGSSIDAFLTYPIEVSAIVGCAKARANLRETGED